MLILKIMSIEDYADADPCKGFRLITGVRDVRFYTRCADDHEKSQMRFKGEGDLFVSLAHCTLVEDNREEEYLLTGNCYVLNDRGKTIESFWARRSSDTGERVGEP